MKSRYEAVNQALVFAYCRQNGVEYPNFNPKAIKEFWAKQRKKRMDKKTQSTMFSSKNMVWGTPDPFYNKLDKIFNFTLDPASTQENAKCMIFFTPEDNGLEQDWKGHTVFCNPPYGRGLKHWIRKGYEEGCKPNTIVVMLIPARTDTIFFHDYCMRAKEIYFIKGRLKFTIDGKASDPAPFPSMVVVFDGVNQTPNMSAIKRE